VEFVADAITDSTQRCGIVLDPFLGAGTTLIAAEQTGRACYAIESHPVDVGRAVRRWQELTGKTAVHEKCGLSFSGLERNG
jgi:DNA modification methylase